MRLFKRRKSKKNTKEHQDEMFLFSQDEMTGITPEQDNQQPDPFVEEPVASVLPQESSLDFPSSTFDAGNEDAMSAVGPSTTPLLDSDILVDAMVWCMRLLDMIDDIRQTRLIAMEALTIAQGGVSDKTYQLLSLPGKTFDNYQFSALCYVSISRAFPSMIDRLHMPYADYYEAALMQYSNRN